MRRAVFALALLVLVAWALLPAVRAVTLIATAPPPLRHVVIDDVALPLEPVTFAASDGVRLAGSLAAAAPGAPAIVLVHGFKSDRAEMLPWARFLHAAGYALLLFDRRGCGASDGWAIGLGATEDRDVSGAVRYLRERLGDVPIGALGISLGAGIVLRAAAREPAIRAAVADSPWADEDFQLDRLRSVRAGPLDVPLLPYAERLVDALVGADVRAARPVDDVARIAPRAVFLIHGADDDNATTSAEAERALAAAARDPGEEWIVPGAGHIGAIDAHPDEYRARVLAFLGRWLR